MIQEIRNGENSRPDDALSNERLEGFAASEMADRGPKAVRMDRRDSDEAAVRPVTAIDEDEDFDDDDMEDDDLALDDVEMDDVDADTADAAVLADDTDLDDDVELDDDDDEDDDDSVL